MKKSIQAIRGMNDIIPTLTTIWQHIEGVLRQVLETYGYQEIRLPLLEKTDLFSRSIGEVTDIVEKEMFTFMDRNGDSLTLRPEGTAGCVRAGIENGLFYNQIQRLWYIGPMFRHERPQQGRYRQFHQIGAEAYGLAGPDIDAEMILMTARFWQKLGLNDLELQINSLGSADARVAYREQLVNYFSEQMNRLDADSQRRLHTNPLRILDSKNPEMQGLIEAAPQLLEHLDEESQEHFVALKQLLDQTNITYRVNPRLVRGLDYYNRTVFEWVTQQLVERLVLLLSQNELPIPNNAPHAYLIMMGNEAVQQGFRLAESLRDTLPQLRLLTHCGGGSLKNQFKRADKSGAKIAIVLGENEIASRQVTLKYLRDNQAQTLIAQSELANYLKSLEFGNEVIGN